MADVDVGVVDLDVGVVDVGVDVGVVDVSVAVGVADEGGIGVDVVDRLNVYLLVVGIGTVLNRSAARLMKGEDGSVSWRDDGSRVTCVDGGGEVRGYWTCWLSGWVSFLLCSCFE